MLNSFGAEDDLGVPGLGFDYPHLAAINAARRNNGNFLFGRREHLGTVRSSRYFSVDMVDTRSTTKRGATNRRSNSRKRKRNRSRKSS